MATHQQTQAPYDSPAPADEKSKTSEVFWDIEDYKIPDGLDAAEVAKNIKTDLTDMGHRGAVTIKAYADETNPIQEDVFNSVGIEVKRVPEGERMKYILTDMWIWALDNGDRSSTLMVISDGVYIPTLEDLKQRDMNVLWKSLSAEGKPIAQTTSSSEGCCQICGCEC